MYETATGRGILSAMDIFLQGLLLGLAYVAPIGTQNLFVINSALTRTARATALCIVAVTCFDIALALACFLGMGALMELWPFARALILLVGSILVMTLGLMLLFARQREGETPPVTTALPLLKVAATAFVVTWLNPQAILDGTMLLGAFRASLGPEAGWYFLAGVMCASCLWFTSLGTVCHLLHRRFSGRILRYLNRVCGVVMFIYGAKLLVDFILLIYLS